MTELSELIDCVVEYIKPLRGASVEPHKMIVELRRLANLGADWPDVDIATWEKAVEQAVRCGTCILSNGKLRVAVTRTDVEKDTPKQLNLFGD